MTTIVQPWREMLADGIDEGQKRFLTLAERTKDSWHFCDNVIWGDLQTPEYAGAMFALVRHELSLPGDTEAAVAARAGRRAFIGRDGRTRRVVLTEHSLRVCIGDINIMRGQLAHLLDVLDTPGLELGILPDRTQMPVMPGTAFSIFDGEVQIETRHANLTLKDDPAALDIYTLAFNEIAASAHFGVGARARIEAEAAAIA